MPKKTNMVIPKEPVIPSEKSNKDLSKEELDRNTIQIFYDLKIAKRYCSKEQKVIKVPNTSVFRIVAPLLISRGISRIVTSDKLIAL